MRRRQLMRAVLKAVPPPAGLSHAEALLFLACYSDHDLTLVIHAVSGLRKRLHGAVDCEHAARIAKSELLTLMLTLNRPLDDIPAGELTPVGG